MYQFGLCVCEAGNRSPEEVDRRRHAVIAKLMGIHRSRKQNQESHHEKWPTLF